MSYLANCLLDCFGREIFGSISLFMSEVSFFFYLCIIFLIMFLFVLQIALIFLIIRMQLSVGTKCIAH